MKEGFKLGFCIGVSLVLSFELGKLVQKRRDRIKPGLFR